MCTDECTDAQITQINSTNKLSTIYRGIAAYTGTCTIYGRWGYLIENAVLSVHLCASVAR